MQPLFDFDDYKEYLIQRIESEPNAGRGVRRMLAEFIGCQVAYVSHILAGDRHLSPEQAEATARFFNLREDEADYLMLMVDYQRAGTVDLQRLLKKKLEQRQVEQRELKKRVRIMKSISPADQALYYSSWHYQAVHTLTTIADLRTVAALAQRLKISPSRVSTIVTFLIERGLLVEKESSLEPTEHHIHLPRTSPLINKLHTNWRVHAITSFDHPQTSDYHYSGILTLTAKDALRIREIMANALSDSIEVAKPSLEEKAYVLGMDFYEL